MPFVEIPDVTLFYELRGPVGAPTIVFSNSLGTTHRMWDEVIADLEHEFCCVLYDTRGHGRSSVATRPFEIADLADDLAALLDALGISSAHIAGLSLGGMTAQSFAARHPERVHSLTLMATTAFMPPQAAWNDRATLVRRDGTQAIVAATLERWFTKGFRDAAPQSLAAVRDAFCAVDREGYAAACEAIGRMNLRPLLQNIHAPTMIIAGREDPATPVAMGEELRDGIRGSELAVLSPAAHLLAVEQPGVTAQHLRMQAGGRTISGTR